MNYSVVLYCSDECQSAPCQNGGTCTDGVNGYTCICAANYGPVDCATCEYLHGCPTFTLRVINEPPCVTLNVFVYLYVAYIETSCTLNM